MKNPFKLTPNMLTMIKNRAMEINNKLPDKISFTPYVVEAKG